MKKTEQMTRTIQETKLLLKHDPNSTSDRASEDAPRHSLPGDGGGGGLGSGAACSARCARGVRRGGDLRGVERAEGLDLEWIGGRVYVSVIDGIGEEDLPSGTRSLIGLVLGDDDGTIKVFLDGNDGEGCGLELRVSIGN